MQMIQMPQPELQQKNIQRNTLVRDQNRATGMCPDGFRDSSENSCENLQLQLVILSSSRHATQTTVSNYYLVSRSTLLLHNWPLKSHNKVKNPHNMKLNPGCHDADMGMSDGKMLSFGRKAFLSSSTK